MAKVVAFANQKGGVAKTTTTLNLGVAFQEMGHQVLVVDMDPQGNLTMSLGLNPDLVRPSMYDVLVERGAASRNAVHHQELDLAVSSIDLAAVEMALELADREGAGPAARPSCRCRTSTTTSSSTRRRRSVCSPSTR